jgi:hypothetical protein
VAILLANRCGRAAGAHCCSARQGHRRASTPNRLPCRAAAALRLQDFPAALADAQAATARDPR